MNHILAIGSFASEAIQQLELNNFKVKTQQSFNIDIDLTDFRAMLIRSTTKVDESFLTKFPQLKLIVTATSGTDHIDFSASQKRGISIEHCPDANVVSVAEHCLWLMFELIKHPRISPTINWRESHRRGSELAEKTLGIIGFGRIGRRLSLLAKTLGMNVIAADPYIENIEFTSRNVEPVGLSELLRLSDFVSLHVPLTSETKGMINHRTLELMSEDSYLINTSRGSIVQESDLIHALLNKAIKGAALDVFESEPLNFSSGLKSHSNLILTPHVAAFTQEAFYRSSHEAVKKVLNFFKND